MSRIGWHFLFILSLAASSKIDIQGEVVAGHDRIDQPILVRLFRGTAAIQETLADPRGRFKFRNVDRGSYVIRVECNGYRGPDLPVAAADSTPHVTITLQRIPEDPALSPAFDPFRSLDIPSRAKKEFQLAVREQKRGQCATAMPHLQKAVTIYPRYGDAFTEIGRCNIQIENPGAAEEAFKKAVEFGSGVLPTVNLASLYVNRGRLDEAEKLIVPLLAKNPAEGELYAALTRIYYAEGRLHDAEIAGLEAHSRRHESPDVHLILAKIYETQQNRAALVTQLRTYLDESPPGPMADQVRKQLQDVEK
jgi:tetratricopeptide (TPR) repeat protein